WFFSFEYLSIEYRVFAPEAHPRPAESVGCRVSHIEYRKSHPAAHESFRVSPSLVGLITPVSSIFTGYPSRNFGIFCSSSAVFFTTITPMHGVWSSSSPTYTPTTPGSDMSSCV